MKVFIKKLSEDAVLPKKATLGAAAYDIYIPHNTTIFYGRQVINLEFAIELPYGYEAKIEPRSGFSCKGMEDDRGYRHDADVIVGKIDSDYRGPVGVIVKSNHGSGFNLRKHTRIAQMTIYKVEDAEFEETSELSDTERGEGGFGHSGV